MRPSRNVLMVATAFLLLVAACGDDGEGAPTSTRDVESTAYGAEVAS